MISMFVTICNSTTKIQKISEITNFFKYYFLSRTQVMWVKPFTVPDYEMGVGISKVPKAQKHGWSWNAVFDSPDNEAFYGLGQHQSEELNMKGKNEDLFQYNTKVSVPFVVSNKNYGILWDSYSFCRWGKPDDYLQLNCAFKQTVHLHGECFRPADSWLLHDAIRQHRQGS